MFSQIINYLGGSVLRCLINEDHNDKFKTSDFDLFLCSRTNHESNTSYISRVVKAAQIIAEQMNKLIHGEMVIVLSKWSMTLKSDTLKIQIILHLFCDIPELLAWFDLDCCCVAYNGIPL